MNQQQKFRKRLEQQARRMKQAEQDRPTIIGQTTYLGTLGLLFVVPVIGGAYLGLWLDDRSSDYSAFWTISLILLGVIIGTLNVYYFIKE